MNQVIVFPRGQLNARDKERLTKHGITAVEADDPSKVRVIFAEALPISGNDMLIAALEAMCSSSGDVSVRSAFTFHLLRSIKAQEASA
jgi:hypothetical protein